MSDLIDKQTTIDYLVSQAKRIGCNGYLSIKEIEDSIKSIKPEKPYTCSEILDWMKDDDYYRYIQTGYSRFSEDDWDWLIRNAKEAEERYGRPD